METSVLYTNWQMLRMKVTGKARDHVKQIITFFQEFEYKIRSGQMETDKIFSDGET